MRSTKVIHRRAFVGLLAFFIAVASAYGAAPQSTAPAPTITAPYCGILSLYAAMKYEGVNATFASFVSPTYVGSSQGSSLAELQACATNMHCYAVPVAGIDEGFLKSSRHPVILHVKSTYRSAEADHYVVILRSDGDQFRVLDPPGPVETLSASELLLRSDGLGLVISKDPISSGSVLLARRLIVGILAAALFLGCLLWATFQTDEIRSNGGNAVYAKRAASQAGIIILFSCATGFIAKSVTHASASPAWASSAGRDFALISFEQLKDRLNQHRGIIIDARHTEDFDAGHIEGAINIPVDMSEGERRRVLASVSKETPVAIYCQSSGCPYSGEVAAMLETDGYQSLSIFRGGWLEWSAKERMK